ncbi:hypothetical protein ACS0TY_019113 [Phlomoides rotata]
MMQVIMRRAERKLQLSRNVIGDEIMDQDGSNVGGTEAGDLKFVVFGLHVFDQVEMNLKKSDDQLYMGKLSNLAEKVIASRRELQSEEGDRKFEINPIDWMNGQDIVMHQASPEDASDVLDLGYRRRLPDEKHHNAEATQKKAEEKKVSKWETLGYHSLAVSNPANQDMMSDSGSVHFVYGDCTNTAVVSPSEATIIFSCVDNSGNWGHGGMFDALARLSTTVPNAYKRALEFGDLHPGDLHLIETVVPIFGIRAFLSDDLYFIFGFLFLLQQKSYVHKFGNCEGDNVPYTTFFENARKERLGGVRINPNNPEQNPEAFNVGGGSSDMRIGPDRQRMILLPNLQRSGQCPELAAHTPNQKLH